MSFSNKNGKHCLVPVFVALLCDSKQNIYNIIHFSNNLKTLPWALVNFDDHFSLNNIIANLMNIEYHH